MFSSRNKKTFWLKKCLISSYGMPWNVQPWKQLSNIMQKCGQQRLRSACTFAVSWPNYWMLQNVYMESKNPDETRSMCRMMWICTFCAHSKTHFCLTWAKWCTLKKITHFFFFFFARNSHILSLIQINMGGIEEGWMNSLWQEPLLEIWLLTDVDTLLKNLIDAEGTQGYPVAHSQLVLMNGTEKVKLQYILVWNYEFWRAWPWFHRATLP